MKIRIIVALTILLLLSVEAMGQYKITKETYKVEVMGLPKYYFKPENRTYGIEVRNSVPHLLSDSYISTGIDMPGWEEVDPEDANVSIVVSVPPFQKMSTLWKDNPTEDHKKDGDVLVHHHWLATLVFVFTCKATIKNTLETQERRSVPLNQEYQKIPLDVTFSTKAEADKYIEANLEQIIKKLAKTNANAVLDNMKTALARFVPMPKTEEISISYILDDKYHYAQMMRQAKQELPDLLGRITADAGIDGLKPGIEAWIQKFGEAAGKLSSSKADESKAKEELLKNMAALSYVIEDLDGASKYAQILKDTFKSKEGVKYLNLVKQLKAEMLRNKATTRHFSLY